MGYVCWDIAGLLGSGWGSERDAVGTCELSCSSIDALGYLVSG